MTQIAVRCYSCNSYKLVVKKDDVCVLRLLTHQKDTDYYDYVQRIIDSGNQTAINVKRNDLLHNIARGKAFGYPELVAKHEKALRMIEGAIANERLKQ